MTAYLRSLALLALILIGSAVLAAPPPPPSGGGGATPPCWPPPCVPIDGGISLLIVAGAAYGAKKLYQSTRKKGQIS